jgi:hypothetical protein
LEDYQHIKLRLQQQDANMIKWIINIIRLHRRNPHLPHQILTKQINNYDWNKSTPFSGSRTQYVVDWLYEFNRKCDDIKLDDTQRLSVTCGLMASDAKLWTDTIKKLLDWLDTISTTINEDYHWYNKKIHQPADSWQELARLEQLKNDFATPIRISN